MLRERQAASGGHAMLSWHSDAARAGSERDDEAPGHTVISPEDWPRPSSADDGVALIDAAQEDVAEIARPNAIGDFLETEDLLLERVREVSRSS